MTQMVLVLLLLVQAGFVWNEKNVKISDVYLVVFNGTVDAKYYTHKNNQNFFLNNMRR